MLQRHTSWMILVFLLTISVSMTLAQDSCAAFVEEAFARVGENCDSMDRNSACYGYNLVNAQFVSAVDDAYFSQPADRAELETLQSIQTTAYNATNLTWGIALLQVQANIPNTIPGQNVTFVLMGDSTLENAVAPEDAVLPTDGIMVILTAGANIHSGPGETFNVLGASARASELIADGLSEDGAWLRVVWQNRIGWIPRRLIEENPAVDDLPIWEPEQRAPMQAFYLQTGIGSAGCADAPTDALLIQGPREMEVDLTVNGANIRVGSTIVVRNPDPSTMEITVVDGQVSILDENHQPTGTVIRAGQRSTACLSDDGREVTCDFSPPETLNFDTYGRDVCTYQGVPTGILNYEIDQVCPGDPVPTTSVTDNRNSGATISEIPGVDCSSFDLVGPFEGITPRPTTFEWTEAPGATEYYVVFYDYNGNEAGAYLAEGTSTTLNVGEIPTGSELQWEVRAYANGEYACVTTRTEQIFRLADPNPPPSSADSSSGSSADWVCIDAFSIRINWNLPSDAESGPTITFTDNANGLFPATLSFGGKSGSTVYGWAMPAVGVDEVAGGILQYDPAGSDTLRTINLTPASLNCG